MGKRKRSVASNGPAGPAGLSRLDVACPAGVKEGFRGIGLLPGLDIRHDLSVFPWPVKSGSVSEVNCVGYAHRAPDLVALMEEIYRVMAAGDKATVVAPYYTSIRAWQDPTTVRAVNEATFLFFNKEWRAANKVEHYGIKADFKFDYGYLLAGDWGMKSHEARDFAVRSYNNVVSDIQVNLEKLGGG
jgi:hypothetical protein